MSRVEVLDTVPVIRFKSDGVPPPSDLFISREDALFITSYNSASSISVHVRGILLRPDGVAVPFAIDTHVPNTNRTAKTTIQNIGDGFLLSASVFLGSGTAKRGQCYVQVGIARGVDVAYFPHRIIMQGYVGNAVNMSWPGNKLEQSLEGPGVIRSITGTDPAAGLEMSEVVPTGARWKVNSILSILVPSATVATRTPRLIIDDGSNVLLLVTAPGGAVASTAQGFEWSTGIPYAVVVPLGYALAPMPIETRLSAGYRLRSDTLSIQAGDNWQAPQMFVEEWIEP